MEPGSRAKAIYDFQGTEPSELTLRAGDVVDIVERIDENWLVGTLDGKTGSFPSSYVTSVLQKKVVAKETFPASTDGDLAFQKGDIIILLDKIDDNWWRGQLGDNIGIFPFNYVEEYNASNNQESQTAGGDAQKARALQDLTGQLHDELSFKKNDVITITEKVDGDWYRGTLNGKNGLVPSFCVEMLASDTSQSSLGTDQSQKVDYSKLNDNLRQSLRGTTEADTKTAKSTSESSEPWAKSMYPFSADNPGELSFMDGEKIILTRRIDEQWLEGRIDGRVGVFPTNYVNIVVDLPPQEFAASTNMTTRTNTQSNGPEKCKGIQGKAMFDFNADTAQDLPLKAGEVITIIVKVDADWYEARNSSGQVGYCPVNYVELLQSKPKKRPAPKPPSKKSPTKVTSFPTATSTEQSVTIFSGSITSAGENHSQEPASLQAGQPLNTATDLTTSLPSTEQKNIFGEGDTAFTAGPATDNSSIGLGNFQAGDSVQNQDPLLPSMYKQGGSSYKSVSFAPKGVSTSSSGDSGKGDMLHRQDAVTQQSPPAIDLSMFDSMAPVKPTTNSESAAPLVPKTLLDASPVVESGGDILAPSKAADSTSKPVDNSSFAFDPLLAPTPFIPGGHKEIKSVHRPVSSGSQSAAPSLTSDFDPFAAESTIQQPASQAPPLVPTSAPVAKPTLETKLRSISQMSHDLDEFFGTADSYTSRVSTLDSIDNVLDPLGSSVAVDSQPFVPFTEVSPQPPPLPPRQPSPNPFAASVEQQQQQQLQSAIMSPSSTASTGSSRQSSLEVTPGWQSKNYSIDSMASEFSDDAGYYHGLTFSIKPLGDSPPVAGGTAFKLPPPPSSPRRPKRLNSEERPQSPKFDPKTAVPRPKPRKSIDSTSSSGSGILQLSTPPPGHPRTQPQPDNRAKVSEALESFEWNVGELQRTDSIESKPPPSHPPPSLLIDVDSEVSAITQRSETVSQSSDSAVDDLLGLGDPFDDSQPLSTATVADSAVKPSRPAPPAPQKGKAPPVARPPPPKKVPPRPAPPKTRPQTIVEDEILGPLRPGGRTMDQNEEYIASLETRINQLDVEIYAIKESKVKFEEMLKVVSDENREDITGQLQECIAEIDKLTEEQSWVKGELKDLRPDPVGDLKKRNAQMRTKVVDELMQTERDYVKDIKLCYEGFIGSLKGQKVRRWTEAHSKVFYVNCR